MKRPPLFIPAILLFIMSCSTSPGEKGWISLFNGEDLSHWTVVCHEEDRSKKSWFVEDGSIVGETFDTTHQKIWLYSNEAYYNFKLRFKYQVEEDNPCNSGVVVRGLWDPTELDGKGFLNGPQVDISSRGWDGAIYDETIDSRDWLVQEMSDDITHWAPKWNEMLIQFMDMQLTVWINGKEVTDYNGDGWFNDENHKTKKVACVAGHIGLQLHAPEIMKVRFKDIEIMELK